MTMSFDDVDGTEWILGSSFVVMGFDSVNGIDAQFRKEIRVCSN